MFQAYRVLLVVLNSAMWPMWLHLNAEANDHKEACVDNMIDYDIDIMWYDKAWKWQEANVVSLSSTMMRIVIWQDMIMLWQDTMMIWHHMMVIWCATIRYENDSSVIWSPAALPSWLMKPLVRQPMPEPTPPHLKEMINITRSSKMNVAPWLR